MGDLLRPDQIEFPEYCIMDGRLMSELRVGALSGIRQSRNACVGCAIPECYGSSRYEGTLEPHQKENLQGWNKYISNRINHETSPKGFFD